MPQDPSGASQAFAGPYGPNDPAANLAHAAVTGNLVPRESRDDKELDAKINRFNVKTDEKVADIVKGKAPTPPSPKAPKPEAWMLQKTPSYKMAHAARKNR